MAMKIFFETGTPENFSLLRIFLKIEGLEFEMICWVKFVSNRFLSLRICKQSYHGTQFLQNIPTKKPYIEKIHSFFVYQIDSFKTKWRNFISERGTTLPFLFFKRFQFFRFGSSSNVPPRHPFPTRDVHDLGCLGC